MSLADVEAMEGTADGLLLVIEASDPATACWGWAKYQGRKTKGLQTRFGRVPQVSWRRWGEVAA